MLDDDLVLTVTGLPSGVWGIPIIGRGQINVPLRDGRVCVGAGGDNVYRMAARQADAGGMMTIGPGIVNNSCTNLPAGACIAPGDTWYFQVFYRDNNGPCLQKANLSNGVSVCFF